MTKERLVNDASVDVVGVGFGPSNLALAIALAESSPTGKQPSDASPPRCAFFEKQPRFGWHRGMLIEGATMQVSFLKDLAAMRNPTSRYTFVSYLHEKDRLAEFINSKTLYPLRVEFHDYLEWAAEAFEPEVSYGCEVVEVRPVVDDGVVRFVDVVAQRSPDGPARIVRRTRNLVIGSGVAPQLPPGTYESARIWHSANLLDRVAALGSLPPRRIAVVGAGQSAAEVVAFLHGAFPDAGIDAVYSRYGYSVADDSPFANGIFEPKSVDRFYLAPDDVKQMLLEYHDNTNYSVVDLDLVHDLYRRLYQERVLGRRRLRVHNASRVRSVEERDGGVLADIEFLPTGAVETLEFDTLVYATGYRPHDPLSLLGDLASECKCDAKGRLLLERDYRIVTSNSVRCGLYLHGAAAEHSHGLSAGLLSNIAVRAGEIVGSILGGGLAESAAV